MPHCPTPVPQPNFNRLSPLELQTQLRLERLAFAGAAAAYCFARDRYRCGRRARAAMAPLFYRCLGVLLALAVLLRLLGDKPHGRTLAAAILVTALLRGGWLALQRWLGWRRLRRQQRRLAASLRRMRPLEQQLRALETAAPPEARPCA